MSYDISLHCPVTKEIILFDEPHQMRGGTYAIGGTRSAELNITYNYGDYYYEVYEENGIREIYGKTGAESVPILENMIQRIRDKYGKECEKESGNYWDKIPSNALKPLYQLITMAKMRPDGIWQGD